MIAPLGRLLTLLGLAAAALALAGCGGGSASDPAKTVTTAANLTLSQTLVSDFTLHGAKLNGTVHSQVTGRGAFSFDPVLGFERIDIPAEHGKPKIREFLDFLPTTFAFTKTTAAGTVLVNGKDWVSVTLAGTGSMHTALPGFAYQVAGLSPQLPLDEIAWGTASATKLGTPIVNHVPFSKYRVTVDLAQAMTKATGATKTAIGEEIAASGAKTAAITVLVDGPGHIVQIDETLPGSGLGAISMALSNFGLKFSSTLPAASTVLGITAKTPAGADVVRSVWVFPT